jgi:hypothetical protein
LEQRRAERFAGYFPEGEGYLSREYLREKRWLPTPPRPIILEITVEKQFFVKDARFFACRKSGLDCRKLALAFLFRFPIMKEF